MVADLQADTGGLDDVLDYDVAIAVKLCRVWPEDAAAAGMMEDGFRKGEVDQVDVKERARRW